MASFDSHGYAPFFLAGRRRGCRVLFPERTFPTKAEDSSGLKHPQAPQPVESGPFL
jgi:hypothetical protein